MFIKWCLPSPPPSGSSPAINNCIWGVPQHWFFFRAKRPCHADFVFSHLQTAVWKWWVSPALYLWGNGDSLCLISEADMKVFRPATEKQTKTTVNWMKVPTHFYLWAISANPERWMLLWGFFIVFCLLNTRNRNVFWLQEVFEQLERLLHLRWPPLLSSKRCCCYRRWLPSLPSEEGCTHMNHYVLLGPSIPCFWEGPLQALSRMGLI